MARLLEDQRNQAIDMLNEWSTVNYIVHHFEYSTQTIHNFLNRYNITGSVTDHARPGLRVTKLCTDRVNTLW